MQREELPMTEPALEEMDKAVRRRSYSAVGSEFELLDALVLHINHGKAKLSGVKHDRDLNFVIGILIARAFNSLWRAREDAVLGYYAECLTLCRCAVEHWATARWIELRPELTNMLLWAVLEEVERPPGRLPSTDKMLKDLGQVGERVLALYDILSKFAHPRSIGLSWLIHFDSEFTFVHAGGYFDQRGVRACLYFLIGTAQACLEPVARLQHRMLGLVDEEWLATGRELSSRAEEFMRNVEAEIRDQANKLE
jgi:hypothetical protein